jgi:hypothetical protein
MPLPRWDSWHTILAGEQPQKYALDRAATGNGTSKIVKTVKLKEDKDGRKCTKRIKKEKNFTKNFSQKFWNDDTNFDRQSWMEWEY